VYFIFRAVVPRRRRVPIGAKPGPKGPAQPLYNSLSVNILPGCWRAASAAIASCAIVAGGAAEAQVLPSEPMTFGAGHVTLGGDVAATFSCTDSTTSVSRICPDDTGFFNYTDYEHSALRMFRLGLTASVKATDRLWILGEIRSEDFHQVQPYALFVRFRPWRSRALDVQAGRVPPTFGAYARRAYGTDNMLIGYPLAYQYLTSLRPDALPANADELIRMRGRGWLSSFSVGDTTAQPGLPLVSAFRWDTGVQLHAANQVIDAAVGVTTGSLGNPLIGDDNAGKQVAGRVALTPIAGLIVGVSGAKGPYLSRDATRSAGPELRNGRFTQTAFGSDVEYSRQHYLIRLEAILSEWRLPILRSPEIALPLRAISTLVEGRYKIRPGLYAAGRFDRLGFSDVTGSSRTAEWDAPVTRVEVGGGYSLQRNLLLKAAVQRNTRAGGRTTQLTAGAMQILYWF
jgi:hypothetical protein